MVSLEGETKYVFPGSFLPQIPGVLSLLHDRGFYAVDVEDCPMQEML